MAGMVRFVLFPSIKVTFLLSELSVLGFTCPYFVHYLIVAIVLIMPLGYLTPLSAGLNLHFPNWNLKNLPIIFFKLFSNEEIPVGMIQ